MSYVVYGGIVLVFGVVLWAIAETWFEMRRYKRDAPEADKKLAATIESSPFHGRRAASRQLTPRLSETSRPEKKRQRKVMQA